MALRTTPAKLFSIIFITLAAVSLLGGYVWHEEHRSQVLEMYVFSLKSGQAIFIRTPDDNRILINGGSNSGIIREVSSVLPFYSRHIDSIIATDTDGKNVSGLIDIMERYSVDHAYIPAITLNSLGIATSSDPAYEAFLDETDKRGVELGELKLGDFVSVGKLPESIKDQKQVTIEVLFPVSGEEFAYSKASGPQVVLKISYGANSILVLNDVSTKVQKYIASEMATSSIDSINSNREVDALVVSQSDAPANMSRELISAIRPKYLVYSKTVSKSGSTAKTSSGSSSKKKAVIDPFAGILAENRFNLKEVGNIKIVYDGKELKIQKTD